MKQLFPLSCLLLGLCCACYHGAAGKTYGAGGAAPQVDCPQGTPPSAACAKRYLMFPFPRVGRGGGGGHEAAGFPRSQRVFGIVKQPRIGRSEPSPDSRRIYDEQSDDSADYQHAAPPPGLREAYPAGLDSYSPPAPRSMSPWAFFLITPNFHSSEHAMDRLMQRRLDDAGEE